MKKEIVYTDEYALILDPKVDAVKGDWVLCRTETDVLWQAGDTIIQDLEWKVIAHRPLTDAPILDEVPLLPPLPQGDDVDALAKYQFRKSEYEIELRENAFVLGYNKAKEKYVEAINAIERLCDSNNPSHEEIWRLCRSLKQQRPTHFECGMLCGRCSAFDDECWSAKECTRGYDYPDIIRTTTNSQGQVELVGKYI